MSNRKKRCLDPSGQDGRLSQRPCPRRAPWQLSEERTEQVPPLAPALRFLPRWVSRRVSEGSLKASGDDGASGGCCLNYCVPVTDGVVKHLPSRGGLLAGTAVCRRRRWDCASLPPLGFHIGEVTLGCAAIFHWKESIFPHDCCRFGARRGWGGPRSGLRPHSWTLGPFGLRGSIANVTVSPLAHV